MPQELILLENVDNLGRLGEVVRVADGYARNYLVPRGLAAKSTPGALRQLEAKKKQLQLQYEQDIKDAQILAEMIEKASVTIPVQAGEDEKLYGSVGAKQITDALGEMNINIDRRCVNLPEPIRQLGMYNVDIQLHEEVGATLKVWVVRA